MTPARRKRTIPEKAQAAAKREMGNLVSISGAERPAIELGYFNGYVDGYRAGRRERKP